MQLGRPMSTHPKCVSGSREICLPLVRNESGVQCAVGSGMFPTCAVGYLDPPTTTFFRASDPPIPPPRTNPWPAGSRLHRATEMRQRQSSPLGETAQDFMHWLFWH